MKILSILLVCVTLISINSCKKYDEGGTHWRTKAKITDKTWKFDYSSDSDTLYEVMDSWKTMQFEKNGDWVVNGNKWGTHNFVKDDENEKVKSVFVTVDSSTTYWDSIKQIEVGNITKENYPEIVSRLFISRLKKNELTIYKQYSNLDKHEVHYNAN
jgi:hypothetical protein